jgi:hypothetical protein
MLPARARYDPSDQVHCKSHLRVGAVRIALNCPRAGHNVLCGHVLSTVNALGARAKDAAGVTQKLHFRGSNHVILAHSRIWLHHLKHNDLMA